VICRIFGIHEKLWIFRRRYIVGTLRNKANISILVLLSSLSPFHWLQNTWPWMTLNGHFALNSVLPRYVWSSDAWLSKLGYSWTSSECCRRTLNRKEQLRHRAFSLRQLCFLVYFWVGPRCKYGTHRLGAIRDRFRHVRYAPPSRRPSQKAPRGQRMLRLGFRICVVCIDFTICMTRY